MRLTKASPSLNLAIKPYRHMTSIGLTKKQTANVRSEEVTNGAISSAAQILFDEQLARKHME